jgi:hypothetical protein
MSRTVKLISLALTLALANSAQASDTERLMAQVPDGWIKGVDKTLPNLQITEYFPPETKDEWIQKLSYEAMSGDGLPDPIEFTNGMAEQQSEFCDDFQNSTIFAGFENGYPTMVQILECGSNKQTKKPLVTMIKAVKGNAALYVVTRIWRLEPPPAQLDKSQIKQLPIDAEELAAWSATLRDIRVCDAALLAHPCE